MQRLEVRGAVRPIYGSLGFKRLTKAVSFDTRAIRSLNSRSVGKKGCNKVKTMRTPMKDAFFRTL